MAKKWEQIANALRERIASGELAAGSRMPRTHELAREYETSRATVALSMARLGREGWIYYRGDHHGWGVATQPRRRRLSRNRLGSAERALGRGFFLTDAAGLGATPEVTTTVSTRVASEDVASRLELEPGEQVVQRHRVMRLDGEVAQVATGSIPASIAAGTPIEADNPGEGGIVARLHELGRGPVHHVERVIPERLGSAEELDVLELGAEGSVCEITRVSYDAHGPVLTESIVMAGRTVELVYEVPAE